MPYHTTWRKNGIIWKFSGYVTAEEIEKANSEFYEDERSDLARFQIIDALEVSDVEWNEVDIKEMAAMDKGASLMVNHLKVAYISVNDKITTKLEKYIEISRFLNSSWIFEGFDSMEAALNWVRSDEKSVDNDLEFQIPLFTLKK